MTDKQKNEILKLIAAHREAAIEFGIVYDKLQQGEFIREEIWKHHKQALDNTLCDILGYLESI